MKIFKTIGFKFTFWYLAILGTLLIGLGCGIYVSLSKRLHDSLDRALIVRAEQIAQLRDVLAIIAGGTFEEEPGELLSFYYYDTKRLVDISHKRKKIPVKKEWVDHIFDGESSFFSLSTQQEGHLRLYSLLYFPENTRIRLDAFSKRPKRDPPLKNDKKKPPREDRRESIVDIDRAVLIVARSTKDIDLTLHRLFQILVFALPLTLILSGCCGVFLLRIILRPVEDITETAKEIEAKDLSKRINVSTEDELGRLATTINLMIARLERAFLRQKELTGDASHELRAPLAVIQAEATLTLQKEREVEAYQKSLEIIAKETDHMAGIIGQLLLLARTESGKEQLNLVQFDLFPFIQELCNSVDPLCQEKRQTMKLDGGDSVIVKGDKALLKTMMLNLLRNAVQYTHVGGKITVSLEKDTAKAIISVSDNGIGIPNEALPHIFKRFYRVDKSRSRESGGSGLGLAICKHIVDLHRGHIHISSQMNNGSTCTVSLPLVFE